MSLTDPTPEVQGIDDAGTAPTGRPVLTAGSDGSLVRTITTDTSGRTTVVGAGTAGTPTGGVISIQGVSGGQVVPVSITGGGGGGTAQADRSTFTDGTTQMTPIGGVYNETGTAPTEDQAAAVRITSARGLHTTIRDSTGDSAMDDTNNAVRVNVVATNEDAVFVVVAAATAIALNKSMISIENASGSTVRVRILSLALRNTQTGAVTGVIGTFELRRATSHSSGTSLTASVVAYDTNNSLNGSVTVRTGATITGESTSLIDRWLWSTDEWGVGAPDVESDDHALQSLFPTWVGNPVPLTLRANQALTLKQTTNSTVGTFDVILTFSVV